MWSPGSQIIYREVTHNKVWTVRPVTVIQDSPDLIALYLKNGTRWKVCTPANGQSNLLYCKANLHPWFLKDMIWSFGDTVFLISPDAAHAVHIMWDQKNAFVGWYVNLQEPVRRTQLGFDFLDQELDIEVSSEGKWRWKDKHHLEEAESIGLFSPEQGGMIRAEGHKVIEMIEAKEMPFDGSWNQWRPPNNWPTPDLPDKWDQGC